MVNTVIKLTKIHSLRTLGVEVVRCLSHTHHMFVGGVVIKYVTCVWSCVTAVCQRWWRCLTQRVRATCTGCLSPACGPARALAHSLSPVEGCAGWGGGAGVSSPPIHSDAEERELAEEGQGRGWCEWMADFPVGKQNWDWKWCWRWWSRRKGAVWSCEPGCSEPGWAQNSTDGGRKGREERLRADPVMEGWSPPLRSWTAWRHRQRRTLAGWGRGGSDWACP